MSQTAVICASKRTPFGAFGGKLKSWTPSRMGAHAAKAAIDTLPKGTQIDSVIFGSVLHSESTAPYLARHIGHQAGLPVTVPALTVNRLCGSGFQSMINAVQEIKLGESHVVLTGGAESMSLAPFTLSGESRWGAKFGIDLKLEDSMAAALTDRIPNPTPMGITAENLAEMYGISREQCDEYALQSQKRWAACQEAGGFNKEIAPITIKTRKGEEIFNVDEHPRPQTTLESLAKLPSVFKKNGTVTAGNASGICDGAAANIVASEEGVKRYGLTPLAKILSYNVTACEPHIMGIGPAEGIRGAIEKAWLKMEDIDVFDVNEAFAAQFLSVQKEIGLPSEKTNLNGGAIALGHPLGASGARIMANLVYTLQRLNKRYGVGSACIGGGQSTTIVIENTQFS